MQYWPSVSSELLFALRSLQPWACFCALVKLAALCLVEEVMNPLLYIAESRYSVIFTSGVNHIRRAINVMFTHDWRQGHCRLTHHWQRWVSLPERRSVPWQHGVKTTTSFSTSTRQRRWLWATGAYARRSMHAYTHDISCRGIRWASSVSSFKSLLNTLFSALLSLESVILLFILC